MAPTKRARIDLQDQDQERPNDLEKQETPLQAGLSYIRTATTSLTNTFGTSLPFLQEYSNKNLKYYAELKRRNETLENTKNADKVPRSIWFKFQLNATAELKNTDKFKELEESVLQPILTCQQALQEKIVKSQTLEIKLLEAKKAEHSLSMICYLTKAYAIAKPEFTNVNPVQVIDSTLDNPAVSQLFAGISLEKSRIFLCAFFGEDNDTVFEYTATPPLTNMKLLLINAMHTLMIIPQVKFDDRKTSLDIIAQLQALSLTATKGPITEDTAMALDKEPSLTSKQLEDLIDKKSMKKPSPSTP